MWMEEHLGTRVNHNRTQEAVETGATTVAVACPFCMTMIGDGTREIGVDDQVVVKDIAEVLAEARLSDTPSVAAAFLPTWRGPTIRCTRRWRCHGESTR